MTLEKHQGSRKDVKQKGRCPWLRVSSNCRHLEIQARERTQGDYVSKKTPHGIVTLQHHLSLTKNYTEGAFVPQPVQHALLSRPESPPEARINPKQDLPGLLQATVSGHA